MGHGTPSVPPEQGKGIVPRAPQRVETPPRSRSAERNEGVPTQREDTPPRSRSAERMMEGTVDQHHSSTHR